MKIDVITEKIVCGIAEVANQYKNAVILWTYHFGFK